MWAGGYLEGEGNVCAEATLWTREKSAQPYIWANWYDSCLNYSHLIIQEFNEAGLKQRPVSNKGWAQIEVGSR